MKSARQLFVGIVLLLMVSAYSSISAATLPPGFTETLVASGISNPTAMAFAPDGRIFVCQQNGQLRVIRNDALLPTPFLTVTVSSVGERGLLGIAFDPDFMTNGYVYVYYTATTPMIHNRVSRFTATFTQPGQPGDTAVPGSEVAILDLDNLSATNHNGGAMHFGLDGKLYIATGENAVPSNAQTLANLLGKMLRINSDGTIPTDNPFYNTASGRNRAIWALGLRNPYTFAFQPGTGRMFINDVGQGTWEEINDGIAGANYGWPNCEGACVPPIPSFRDPIYQYPNDGSTCAITGGTFYNPSVSQFPSEYIGTYFFADFCAGFIKRLNPSGGSVSDFATGAPLPVDLQVGLEGSLYYLARGGGGAVYRIQYTGGQPTDPVVVTLSRDASGNLVATVRLTNPTTETINNVVVTQVRASTLDESQFVDGVPVPQSFGSVAPGQTVTAVVTFPGTSGVPPGFTGLVRVVGTYQGGIFNEVRQVVTP